MAQSTKTGAAALTAAAASHGLPERECSQMAQSSWCGRTSIARATRSTSCTASASLTRRPMARSTRSDAVAVRSRLGVAFAWEHGSHLQGSPGGGSRGNSAPGARLAGRSSRYSAHSARCLRPQRRPCLPPKLGADRSASSVRFCGGGEARDSAEEGFQRMFTARSYRVQVLTWRDLGSRSRRAISPVLDHRKSAP